MRSLRLLTICISTLLCFSQAEATYFQGLGDLAGGGFYSGARGTSADGSVVVGQTSSGNGGEAFLWDSINGMRSVEDELVALGLNLTGWELYEALSISDDGRTIVGSGFNPTGNREAWIAVIPIPGAAWLLGSALLGFVTVRRKSKK